ncbi:MAG: tRNA pseudouridine(55) synthase TruB [Eubacterium sp.]|nr:tRNA pseudouridine(55) synthase TruB [Eubacterium sp.]
MDGIIIVDKEKGYTSFDCVAKLRGILKTRKIGHTGTLDPDATGVLPVCVGRATKVCEVLTDRDKTYEATVVLGITTDTLDTTGEVLSRKPVNVTRDGLLAVLSHFKGEITQVPPMYSAVKVNGKRLYEYAREGKEVSRKERRVTVYGIELLEENLFPMEPQTISVFSALPFFRIRVKCSKGTYIRTLCDDIGRELGCGAAMSSLIRTEVGRFRLEDALRLDEIEEKMKDYDPATNDEQLSFLIPVDEILNYPRLKVLPEGMQLLANGNPLSEKQVRYDEGGAFSLTDGKRFRIYSPDNEFYALYKWSGNKHRYVVEKYFHGS